MALLDFLKNRNAERQQAVAQNTQQQKPENAKQMYARQDAQKAPPTSMDRMPPEQLAKVDEIKARMEKATQHVGQEAPARQTSSAETPVSPEAMRQNQVGQDKAAPAMSPTSAQAGITSVENGASVRPSPTPPKPQQAKTVPQRPQTIARRPPSWER